MKPSTTDSNASVRGNEIELAQAFQEIDISCMIGIGRL